MKYNSLQLISKQFSITSLKTLSGKDIDSCVCVLPRWCVWSKHYPVSHITIIIELDTQLQAKRLHTF